VPFPFPLLVVSIHVWLDEALQVQPACAVTPKLPLVAADPWLALPELKE